MPMQHKKFPPCCAARREHNRIFCFFYCLLDRGHFILAMGLAHVFASDAHSCHSRTPHMGELHRWVEECCDGDYAAILLEENPRRLLRGKPMVGMDF